MEIKVKRSYKYANVPEAKSANVNQTFFENTNVQTANHFCIKTGQFASKSDKE
jgi:hypothetical protein